MGRYSRRKPVPHLTYPEPLFAVCGHDPKTGEVVILDRRAPQPREEAQDYADILNAFATKNGRHAFLCPISQMVIDTTPVDEAPSVIVLEPSGEIVEKGSYDECKAAAAEANRLDDAKPTGQRAVVRVEGPKLDLDEVLSRQRAEMNLRLGWVDAESKRLAKAQRKR